MSEQEKDPGRWYWRAFVALVLTTTAVFLYFFVGAL